MINEWDYEEPTSRLDRTEVGPRFERVEELRLETTPSGDLLISVSHSEGPRASISFKHDDDTERNKVNSVIKALIRWQMTGELE